MYCIYKRHVKRDDSTQQNTVCRNTIAVTCHAITVFLDQGCISFSGNTKINVGPAFES